MADWRLTVTTIYCDAVDDDVSLVITCYGTAKCTAYKKYAGDTARDAKQLLEIRGKRLGRELRCVGPLDFRVTRYRDEIMAQDKAASGGEI